MVFLDRKTIFDFSGIMKIIFIRYFKYIILFRKIQFLSI